jgi:integrase
MSVERVQRKSGAVWRVRWRENGKPRSRVMGSKRDAELFEADITRRKRLGQLAQIDAGRQTVAEFAREWWRIHAEPNLATRTRETYAAVFDKHILPRVGGLKLREITPAVVAGLSADMQAAGVGPAATRKALMVLQGIFSCAVSWGHVQSNPVVGVRKPSAKRQRAVTPPAPAVVERMRGELLAAGQVRDATLLTVLAYAGLRPQEALGLPWNNVRGRTLLIDRAQSDEGLKDTKTGGTRSVRLLAPLAADLAAWRLASGPLVGEALVFPTRDGELWRDHDWANWRRRVFDPLAATVGVSGMRPYDLRHAFCSLLIGEGMSVVEVARQAGHAPTMTLATYAHVIADLEGSERVTAEASIRAAREAEVSGKCPPQATPWSGEVENPSVLGMGDPGLEPGTSSLSEKRSNRLS